MNSKVFSFGAAALTLLAATSVAAPPKPAHGRGAVNCQKIMQAAQSATVGGTSSTGELAASMPVSGLLNAFVGEFDGSIEMRNGSGRSVKSTITASSRLDESGALTTAFVGSDPGQSVSGGMRLTLGERNSVRSCSFSSPGNFSFTANGMLPNAGGIVLSGRSNHAESSSTNQQIEHVLNQVSRDEFRILVYAVNADGSRSLRSAMQLFRMPVGQVSAAAARFEDSTFMTMFKMVDAAVANAASDSE